MLTLFKDQILPAVLAIIFVGALGSAVYFYRETRDLQKNPQKITQQEIQDLIAKIGKLIILPQGETPTVATVSEPERLKDQQFFANAKVGDKVLIYTKAKKAILCNPSTNKIIEVAPVTIGANTAGTVKQ